MRTTAVCFPFDLFGNAGTSNGADLLADACREMLADNRRERTPTRAKAYTEHVRLTRVRFEKMTDYRDWRRRGRKAARRVWEQDEFLLWIAGNHLGALPVYDELAAHHPDTLAIQFDAHLDIHNFSECTAEPSHGNFLMHCDGALPPILNVGHRDLLLPQAHISKYFRATYSAEALALDVEAVIQKLRKRADAAARVFIDIDCDVFDPAYFPAVSHALPFGISPSVLLRCLDAVWSDRVAGVAISEFDPARDQGDRSLSVLAWLVEYLLLRRYAPKT
jgi:arginase family enzyme